VLATFVGVSAWPATGDGRLAAVSRPERALARVSARMLDLDRAIAGASWLERGFYEATVTEGARPLSQAIAWYEELARARPDRVVELHLAILEAEAGRLDRVRRARDPLLAAVYLGAPDPARAAAFRPVVDATLHEWFHDVVAARLAARARLLASAHKIKPRKLVSQRYFCRTVSH